MKTTLILLVLALFYLCHVTYAYDAELCDDVPTDTGFGRAYSFKWRFIKQTRQCTSFLWGGQGYTANFFPTEALCRQFCLS